LTEARTKAGLQNRVAQQPALQSTCRKQNTDILADASTTVPGRRGASHPLHASRGRPGGFELMRTLYESCRTNRLPPWTLPWLQWRRRTWPPPRAPRKSFRQALFPASAPNNAASRFPKWSQPRPGKSFGSACSPDGPVRAGGGGGARVFRRPRTPGCPRHRACWAGSGTGIPPACPPAAASTTATPAFDVHCYDRVVGEARGATARAAADEPYPSCSAPGSPRPTAEDPAARGVAPRQIGKGGPDDDPLGLPGREVHALPGVPWGPHGNRGAARPRMVRWWLVPRHLPPLSRVATTPRRGHRREPSPSELAEPTIAP